MKIHLCTQDPCPIEEAQYIRRLENILTNYTNCPCGDDANHNNGDPSSCVQGGVIKNNL